MFLHMQLVPGYLLPVVFNMILLSDNCILCDIIRTCLPLNLRCQKWLDICSVIESDIPVVMTRGLNAFSPKNIPFIVFYLLMLRLTPFICFSRSPVLAGSVFGNNDILSYVQ